MAMQYSVAVRDAQNDAFEATVGTGPTLEIRTGAPPANCAADDTVQAAASAAWPALRLVRRQPVLQRTQPAPLSLRRSLPLIRSTEKAA